MCKCNNQILWSHAFLRWSVKKSPVSYTHPSLMTSEDSNDGSSCTTKAVGLMQTQDASEIHSPEEPEWTEWKPLNIYKLVINTAKNK